MKHNFQVLICTIVCYLLVLGNVTATSAILTVAERNESPTKILDITIRPAALDPIENISSDGNDMLSSDARQTHEEI